VNFLRRLALQEKKLDDSSRLDVVEIASVSFLVGIRTYQHPVLLISVARKHKVLLKSCLKANLRLHKAQ